MMASASAALEGVYFLPWVGENYRGKQQRLLLLGESHYGEPRQTSDLTQVLTQSYVDGEWNHRFWTGLMRVIDGPQGGRDRPTFWSSVSFYNYVQHTVGKSAGIPPTPEDFKEAADPFKKVLAHLRPTHVLVTSKRLRHNLPEELLSDHREQELGKLKREVAFFKYGEERAVTTWITHPSRSSPLKWHNVVADFLKETGMH